MPEPGDRAPGPVQPPGEAAEQETKTLLGPPRPVAGAVAPAPPPDSAAGQPVDLRPGAQFGGRYTILDFVARGGMGLVFSAYDSKLDRRVALKLLRDQDKELSAERQARMLREAQAMARVSHPNVCTVFDVGTWGEQFFVVMEFINGPTLAHWLREPRLWEEVLALFLQAGQGLMAAHEAGLVHRDFKPSNVLLAPGGRACVTDFGLARRVAAPGHEGAPPGPPAHLPPLPKGTLTPEGTVMGTPLYMPPEQYLGEAVEPRSDQFSFCTALYEALYRQHPFEPERVQQAVYLLAAGRSPQSEPRLVGVIQEPPGSPRVPDWVRQAVLRGLALEPKDRFGSMRELLAALSPLPRRTRRRWALGLGAAAVAVVLGVEVRHHQEPVCAGADRPLVEVWNAQARQRMEEAFAATGRPSAAEAASSAARRMDTWAHQWVQQSTEACEATRVQGVQTEELLSLRVVCLERRRKDLQALVHLLTAQVDTQVVDKAVELTHTLPSLHECKDVEAMATQRSLPAEPALRAEVEALEGSLAEVKVLMEVGRYPQARELLLQLEPRVQATAWRPLLVELHLRQGWLEYLDRHADKAAELLTQALHGAEAERLDRLRIWALTRLLFIEATRGQGALAQHLGGVAEAVLQRIGGDPLLSSELLSARGVVAFQKQQLTQAQLLLERARELQAQVLPEEDLRRGKVTFQLGKVAWRQRDLPRARALLAEALQQTEAVVGPRHPDVARRHALLAQVLLELKQYPRARSHIQAALEIQRALGDPEELEQLSRLDILGMSLLGLGRHAEAEQSFRQALERKLLLVPPEHPELQYSYDGIGQALLGQGRLEEATRSLEQALTFTSAPPSALAESQFALARALWQSGQPQRARAEAQGARERFLQEQRIDRLAELETWLQSLQSPASAQAAPP